MRTLRMTCLVMLSACHGAERLLVSTTPPTRTFANPKIPDPQTAAVPPPVTGCQPVGRWDSVSGSISGSAVMPTAAAGPSPALWAASQMGVWKSTDGGDTFSELAPFHLRGGTLFTTPTQPDWLVVQSFSPCGPTSSACPLDDGCGDIDVVDQRTGLFSSRDGGASWHFFGETFSAIALLDSRLAAIDSTGHARLSDDGGASFADAGPIATPDFTSDWETQLVRDPSAPLRLYAKIGSYVTNTAALYRSDDAGEHWALVGSTHAFEPFDTFVVNADGSLMVSDVRGMRYDSPDGITWQEEGWVGAYAFLNFFAADPFSPADVYSGTYAPNALYRRNAQGEHALALPEPFAHFYYLGVARDQRPAHDSLFVSAVDRGLFRSDPSGDNPVLLSHGINHETIGWITTPDPQAPHALYLATENGSHFVYRSLDSGASWQNVFQGAAFGNVRQLVVAQDGKSILLVPTDAGVYRSEDDGVSWSKPYTTGPTDAWSAIVDPANPARVIVAEPFVGAWHSEDAGKSWTLGSGPWEPLANYAWTLAAPNGNFFLTAFEGDPRFFVPADGKILVSSDAGVSWQSQANAFGVVSEWARNDSGRIYVAAHNQLFYSDDSLSTVHTCDSIANVAGVTVKGAAIFAKVDDSNYLVSFDGCQTFRPLGSHGLVAADLTALGVVQQDEGLEVFVGTLVHGVFRYSLVLGD